MREIVALALLAAAIAGGVVLLVASALTEGASTPLAELVICILGALLCESLRR